MVAPGAGPLAILLVTNHLGFQMVIVQISNSSFYAQHAYINMHKFWEKSDDFCFTSIVRKAFLSYQGSTNDYT